MHLREWVEGNVLSSHVEDGDGAFFVSRTTMRTRRAMGNSENADEVAFVWENVGRSECGGQR